MKKSDGIPFYARDLRHCRIHKRQPRNDRPATAAKQVILRCIKGLALQRDLYACFNHVWETLENLEVVHMIF